MSKDLLSLEARRYIVTELAMWESPTIVKNAVKEIYGVEVSLPGILNYDGTRPGCAKKWKVLFDETRKAFVEDITTIPIANKAYRVRELNKLLDNQKRAAKNQQNTVEMRATLEQAAKEAGDAFTNKRELTGKGGAPLVPDKPNVIVYLPSNDRGDADETAAATPEPALSAGDLDPDD